MRNPTRQDLIDFAETGIRGALRGAGPPTGASDSTVNGQIEAYHSLLDFIEYDEDEEDDERSSG